jgi:tRNA pseudouridine13 synthase
LKSLLTRCKLALEDEELLLSLLDRETVDSVVVLYNRILSSPLRPPRKAKEYGNVKSAPVTDRGTRTKIHHAIRKVFGARLETSTDGSGTMFISAAPQKSDWTARAPVNGNKRGHLPPQKGRLGWQELGGEYLHFTLYKENKDTMEVISYLAKSLKMKPQSFQFAGTKDRRGVTVQRVSVFRVFADRMINVGKTLRNAKIGNFDYQPSGLQLGQLTGNEFVITLRDCRFSGDVDFQDRARRASEIVDCAIQNLKQNGFLNYYGLQRFGTFSTRTDAVGTKMLQGDFEAAVKAILDFSPTSLAAAQDPTLDNDKVSADDKARAYALNLFHTTGKAHDALKHLPRKFSAEASIIRHLGGENRGRDYHGALQTVSRNLRLMYVHAYQSLVWNVAASERWKLWGPRVVEGDLVLIEEHKDKIKEDAKPDGVDADGEVVVQPGEDDRALNPVDIFTRAKALNKEEASSGQYSIFDIVLPTPGYDILYPANEMLDVYKTFMASERGGGLDPLDMHRKWKDVNLSGSYRKLLGRPGEDISFEIRTYKNENEQFVQTDLDRLLQGQQQTLPQQKHQMSSLSAPHPDGAEEKNDVEVVPENVDARKEELAESAEPSEEEKIAVILKLQLGSSQYATMALRELMKAVGVQTYKPDFGGGR